MPQLCTGLGCNSQNAVHRVQFSECCAQGAILRLLCTGCNSQNAVHRVQFSECCAQGAVLRLLCTGCSSLTAVHRVQFPECCAQAGCSSQIAVHRVQFSGCCAVLRLLCTGCNSQIAVLFSDCCTQGAVLGLLCTGCNSQIAAQFSDCCAILRLLCTAIAQKTIRIRAPVGWVSLLLLTHSSTARPTAAHFVLISGRGPVVLTALRERALLSWRALDIPVSPRDFFRRR